MVLIKSKKCSDGYNSGYLYKALNYLYDKEKALHIGGFGVDPYDLNSTYEQMIYVKNYLCCAYRSFFQVQVSIVMGST